MGGWVGGWTYDVLQVLQELHVDLLLLAEPVLDVLLWGGREEGGWVRCGCLSGYQRLSSYPLTYLVFLVAGVVGFHLFHHSP